MRICTRSEIAKLHDDLDATMIYVTHDQIEAMTLADKIVVLQAGVVEQVGSPLELYHHPTNLFVAGFIGSPAMNLVTARVTDDGARVGDLTLPFGPDTRAEVGKRALTELVVGVRPEHLHLTSDGAAGTVVVVEELGSEAYIHVRMPQEDREELLVIRVDGETKIERNDVVHVGTPDKVHFFDPGGDRLGDVDVPVS